MAHVYLSKSADSLTWHKRLGDINQEYMAKETIKSHKGLINEFSCDVCLQNKSTRIVSRHSPIKAKKPLEKIYSDLSCPITPVSLGNNKYVVTFTDDYSRYSWVYPCAEKSNCLGILEAFKKAMENELNQRITFFHCDNGGEYSSLPLKHLHKMKVFKSSTPYLILQSKMELPND